MVNTRRAIKERNNQAKRTLVRTAKAAKGKGKPIGEPARLANLVHRSEKKQRAGEYRRTGILAVSGAPYWPPLTKKILKLLKEQKGCSHNGFVFKTLNQSRNRIVFKTQMKLGKLIFGKTSACFEINLGQRTIRYAPELKQLGKPNLNEAERLKLLGNRRV